jgi:alkylation response protein AidB-like acyl-CoA dehydrogenase
MSAAGDHPFVEAVARFAEEELRPAALATDAAEVPRAAIDRLRALGALNHLAPAAYGLTDEAADDTAQLHARSAQFCLVQGQSAAARDAHLARLAADVPNRPTIQESLSLQ